MSRNVTLPVLLAFAQMVALAGGAPAQTGEMATYANTTNACIDSTYKFWTPDMANPTLIIIDRRVTFNPMTLCTTAGMNSAFCNRDPGTPMLLVASAFSTQFPNSPFCSWNCGACGTIVTDGPNQGLPVELMGFGFEDEEPAEGAVLSPSAVDSEP